jgi:hypothetical protein
MTRKKPAKPSRLITPSSCSSCARCRSSITAPPLRAPRNVSSRSHEPSSWPRGPGRWAAAAAPTSGRRRTRRDPGRLLQPRLPTLPQRAISAGDLSRHSPFGCSTPQLAAVSTSSSARCAVSRSCTSRLPPSTYRGSLATTQGTPCFSASSISAPASAASSPDTWCSCTSTAMRPGNSSRSRDSRNTASSGRPARISDASSPLGRPRQQVQPVGPPLQVASVRAGWPRAGRAGDPPARPVGRAPSGLETPASRSLRRRTGHRPRPLSCRPSGPAGSGGDRRPSGAT